MLRIFKKGELRNEKNSINVDESESYLIEINKRCWYKVEGDIPSLTYNFDNATRFNREFEAKKVIRQYGGTLAIFTRVAFYEYVVTNIPLDLNDYYMIKLNSRVWFKRVLGYYSFENNIFEADSFRDYYEARELARRTGGILCRVSFITRYDTINY